MESKQVTLKAPRPSPGRNINPSGRMMRAMERDAEARLARALNALRIRMMQGVNEMNVVTLPQRLARQDVLQPFADAVTAVIRDIALAGADFGREQVERYVFGTEKRVDIPELISVGWELINTAAEEFARRYSYELVTGITRVTRDRLQKEVSAFVTNQESLNQLARRISSERGPFGPVRAKMIAVTETTRAFAEGNQIAWRESGVIERKRWNASNDELVCPICGPLDGNVVNIDEKFDGGYESPPAHVNCRCWITPVVNDDD